MKYVVTMLLLVVVATLMFFSMDEPSYAQGTRQPRGYLTTPAELAEIRQKADQGLEPYASSVKDVLSYANQAWDFSLVSPVTCENADDPAWIDNTGGIPILYGKALAYHLTGDAAYAAEVKTILERIMTNIGSISLTELQCQLNFGWGTPELVASADLIEGYWNDMTCTGPTSTVYGQNQLGKGPCKELFQNWLVKNPYYIVSYPAEASGNNWGAAATNTLAYIADYLSDRPDVKLINRMPRELGGQDTAYSPAAAYARANTLAVERMNGYRVDYQSSLACDYLAGAQQLAHYTPVKSQITEKGIIPEDARREEYCNIPLYNGIYQNYPQIHLGNLIQQCELMRRRGDVSCFDNVDMTDLPNYTFLASDGTYKTTHLYAGRGSVERAINAVIIDAQTDWEHAPALQVAYRYYAVSGKLGYTAWWDEHFRAYAKCDQDICFGRLTHGFAADELLATPTPTAIFSPTPPVSPTNTPVYTATATALPPTNTLTSTPSATPTTPGTTGTLTITPSEDTLIKLAYPTSTYGERTYLRVREALPDDDIHTYLKFEVPASVGTVVSAKLRLYAYDGSYDGGAVYSTANTYRDSDQAWTEDALNWNNAPALSDKPLSVAGAISANTWVEFDVSAAVMQGGVYSFAISNSVTNSVYFYAKEFASNLPQLVITTDAKLPTATHTPVYTATYTPTAVPTNTATNTPTYTPTAVPTNTPVHTATNTPTAIPTNTPVHTATYTPTAIPTTTTEPPAEQVLTPSEDTMVKLAYPTSNYGDKDYVRVREALPSEQINTYLKFDVPDGDTITRAILRLYAYDASYDGGTVYSVSNQYRESSIAWDEDDLIWKNAPPISSAPLSAVGAVAANVWIEVDVTAAITRGGTYSFAISNASTNSVYYFAKEHGTNGPQLVISRAGGGVATATPTALPTNTPTITPTDTVDVTPTFTPTATPPDQALLLIEAEDDWVQKYGEWTTQNTTFASGYQYIYSEGNRVDTLMFPFQGTRLDVIYIKHPSLGSFAVEVDGVVRRVVIATSDTTIFGATESLTDLAPGSHIARIVPVKGMMALDAFTVFPPDTSEPDMALRVIESDVVEVQASGAWTTYDSTLASGERYIYSSGSTDDTLTLTFTGSHLEIVFVRHPALGVFSVEIDGAVYQAISSRALETQFDARAVLDDLGEGPHTVRIVPVNGVIAIDAFAVE